MRLSKELMKSGLLGHHRETHSAEYDLSLSRTAPSITGYDAVSQVVARREQSLKVSTRGWKAIVNVLSV